MFGILGLLIVVPSVALISIFYQQYKETKKISFLSGSELDSFIRQFNRESQKQKRKKQRKMEKNWIPKDKTIYLYVYPIQQNSAL